MTAASALYFLKKTAQNLAIIQDQELSGTAEIPGITCCALRYGDFKLMQMSDFDFMFYYTNYFWCLLNIISSVNLTVKYSMQSKCINSVTAILKT